MVKHMLSESFRLQYDKQAVLDKLLILAERKFKQRANKYDVDAIFPAENFDDLFKIGAMALPVSREWGGLECSSAYGDADSLWQMTRAIAQADLSFARCWEGHNNALMLIDRFADTAQKKRWLTQVVDKGERWAAWSGEPQKKLPGQQFNIGTKIDRVEGGYLLNGNKVFATSAPGVNWAVLLVSLAGPGGARDASDGENSLLMVGCDMSDPSISFDGGWWDPLGMRSTTSYKVIFNNTFIPDEHCLGEGGEYIASGMQNCFTPHYAVSFLGALEAAYSYALDMVQSKNCESDPYVQHHIAEIKINIETLVLWKNNVENKLIKIDQVDAGIAGNKFRYLSEKLAEDGVKRCIKICGARGLNKPSHLERIYRDLSIYVQHDNADHILATIGREALGIEADTSFFKIKT